MKRTTFLSGAAALAGTALPAAARAQYLNQGFAQQLTIAVNAPLSRESHAVGEQLVAGVRAAVDEMNRTSGTLSTAFAVRTFDDMDALAQSITNVSFAASDPSILAVIAGTDGQLVAATMPQYDNRRIPLLVPACTADAITARGYRNVWRLPTKDSTEGQLFARYIAGKDRPKVALAVTQDGDYGPDVARGFVDQANASKINADAYIFPVENPDYNAAAARILSKHPDYVYLCGETAAMGPVISALRAAGYAGRFGASEGFYNQKTIDAYGAQLEGATISTSFPPLERAPDVANELADFRSRYPVTALSAFAYAAAQIVMRASRRIGATNRLSMMTALQAPIAYQTIVGSFQFAPTGDPIDPNAYFYAVTGGKFKFAAPAHATSFVL